MRKRIAAWARRRQGLDAPPFAIQQRRLYILPTRAGSGFAVLLLCMLIAGLNYANGVALFLTFLLGGFMLVTMHQCHRNLLGVTLEAIDTQPAFAGQRATTQLALQNTSAAPRYRIEASLSTAEADDVTRTPDVPPPPSAKFSLRRRSGKRTDKQAAESTAVTDLAPTTRENMQLSVHANKRGIQRLGHITLATRHPFGLFRAWAWIYAPAEIVVYPKAQGTLPMPSDSGHEPGNRAFGAEGADEWLGLRPFRDGDSPRQVAWKAYARGAPLLIKEYHATGSDLRMFDLAQLPHVGDLEARLEQLARWIVDAEAQGERYGVALPEIRIEPDNGPDHRRRCLTALALHGVEKK